MNLDVTFRNLNPRAEVTRRGQALYSKLEKFLEPASEGTLTISTEHGQAIVELVVATNGTTHKSSEEHDELRAAMDLVFHRMETQLRRAKEKRAKRARKGDNEGQEVANEVEESEDY